jgi:hypothetical protein
MPKPFCRKAIPKRKGGMRDFSAISSKKAFLAQKHLFI